MSYILEALRKAERERQLGEAPSVPEILSVEPGRKRGGLLWLAALLLLLLNGGLLWHFWLNGKNQRNQSVPPPVPETRAEPKTVPKTQTQPKIMAPPTTVQPAITPIVPRVEASPADQPVQQVARPSPAPIAHQDKPPSVPRESIQAAPRRNEHASSPQAVEKTGGKLPGRKAQADEGHTMEDEPLIPSFPTAMAKRSLKASDEEPVAASNVPSLHQMPEAIRESVSGLKINVLAYSNVPTERFAVINMVKYTRGSHLPGGALVQDIQANGVVLELHGRRFMVSN